MPNDVRKKIKQERKRKALKSGSDPGNRSQRRLKREKSSVDRGDGGDRSRPSLWTRWKRDRNQDSSQAESRQTRVNTVSDRDSPQIGAPPGLSQNKEAQQKQEQKQKQKRRQRKPDVPVPLAAGDLETDPDGHTLFPVETHDGKVEYKLAKTDLSGRTLFPVRIDGRLKYIPAQSQASQTERTLGLFVDDTAITKPSAYALHPNIDGMTFGTKSEIRDQGRTLFATQKPGDSDSSLSEYLPIKSEATPQELSQGRYIDDEEITKPSTSKLRPDIKTMKFGTTSEIGGQGRTLFATERPDPSDPTKTIQEYLPRKDDATAAELSQGRYIDDKAVETASVAKTVLNKRPKFDFRHWRPLIAVELEDGNVEYLPKRSQANPQELQQGRYVEDGKISKQAQLGVASAMTNGKPQYDRIYDRKLFPVGADPDDDATALLYAAVRQSDVSRDENNQKVNVFYLPRESEATAKELAQGFYLPDEAVDKHQRKLRRTALRDDEAEMALRRSNRAKKLPAKVNRSTIDTAPKPVRQALDGTELWDGLTPPEIGHQRQREVLDYLDARYNPFSKRILYSTEVARGKTKYLPLWEDATAQERRLGLYAAFVPQEPLTDYLQRDDVAADIAPQSFETELGEVRAYALADIERAFETAPQLVLRSAQLARSEARETPELQQQFSEA